MAKDNLKRPLVIVPNWNGEDSLRNCLDSLRVQTLEHDVIVVDNGSVDESVALIEQYYSDVILIRHDENKGFAGGVNAGLRQAMHNKYVCAALLNNDAVADKGWLESLSGVMQAQDRVGIVASKILDAEGKHLDSTGEGYTAWGLPFPRGRGEPGIDKYDQETDIFAASGGASLYRVKMLEEIGLFDEDFFAYYEDVDLSFRAQLAGWKVCYAPKAIAYHQIGATSGKIKGFTAYQTMKNLQLLYYKNIPRKYFYKIGWRFTVAHTLFLLRAISRGQGLAATRGDVRGTYLLFKKSAERKKIQGSKKVSDAYIWSMLVHDLPPNAQALRKLRRIWWKLLRKRAR